MPLADLWTYVVLPLLSFVGGLSVALWRAFTVVSRLALAEHRINNLEHNLQLQKDNLDRVENRVLLKLDEINKKLDEFILDSVRRK